MTDIDFHAIVQAYRCRIISYQYTIMNSLQAYKRKKKLDSRHTAKGKKIMSMIKKSARLYGVRYEADISRDTSSELQYHLVSFITFAAFSTQA